MYTFSFIQCSLIHPPEAGVKIQTPPTTIDYSRLYIPTLADRSWLVFKVRACKDVWILLSTVTGTHTADRYEIRLGDDDKAASSVWKNGVESKFIPLILKYGFEKKNAN